MVFNVTKCSHGNYSVNIRFVNVTKCYMGIIPSIYGVMLQSGELFRQYMVFNVTKCSHGNYSVNIWFLMLQSVYMGIIPSIYGF